MPFSTVRIWLRILGLLRRLWSCSRYGTADLEMVIEEFDGTSYMRVSVSVPFHSSMPFRSAVTTLSVSTLAPMVSPTL